MTRNHDRERQREPLLPSATHTLARIIGWAVVLGLCAPSGACSEPVAGGTDLYVEVVGGQDTEADAGFDAAMDLDTTATGETSDDTGDGLDAAGPGIGDGSTNDSLDGTEADSVADGGPDTSADAGPDTASDSDGSTWPTPNCIVAGAPALTFSSNEGATMAPTSESLSGVVYAHGVVATDTPGVLWATVGTSVMRSEDYGCNWSEAGVLGWSPMRLAQGPGERVWAWSDNATYVYRIDPGTPGSALIVDVSPDKAVAVLGLAADRDDPDHVRLGTKSGQLLDSSDGGQTWQPVGNSPPEGILGYRVALDPSNLDHALFGRAVTGLYVTFDAGATWTQSTGLNAVGGGNVNAFNVVVSPADRNVVWAMALDIAQSDNDPNSNGKHLFRSTNGGESFLPVVAASDTVTLVNGPLMVPHPADENVLYFVFGTYFQGYGTDLFRFDAATSALTKTHSDYHGIGAIAFPPQPSSLMYIALEHEAFNDF